MGVITDTVLDNYYDYLGLKQIDEDIWIVDGNEIHMSFKLFKVPLLYKLVFMFGDNKYPKFRTSRDLRSSFIFRKQAKDSFSKIESWKPDKIVFSQGKIILENGTEKLKEAFYWLRK